MNAKKLYVSLGSNKGKRSTYLKDARTYLDTRSEILVKSSVIETEPVGIATEKNFLNQVLELDGSVFDTSGGILEWIIRGERRIGRDRSTNAPDRVIDIDILYWGAEVNMEEPIIPHPRLPERRFVLQPMVEIAPDFMHPVSGKTQEELLSYLEQT